jgi:hypothetical protein
MVLATGCGPKAPVVKDVPVVSSLPGASASGENGKLPTSQPVPGDPNPPPDQPPAPPPEESALAKETTSDLIGKLGNDATGQAAARVLAQRGGSEVIEALAGALAHENWQVRAGAAFALGQMGQAALPAKAALEKAVAGDAEQTVKDAAAFALEAIGESK